MEDRHVRWATPTMSEVEWAQDRLPPYLNEKRVRDNLARAEAGAYVLVAADPMLHRVDDGDGTEACWFWRAHCLLVSTQDSKARRKVVAIRLTSVAMHEAGDVAADMGEDFACQVLRFMQKVLKVEVVDVP